MKKILSVLCVFTMFFALTGCNEKRCDITPVTKGITFTANISYYNECFECLVTVKYKGDMAIEMTSPDTVKGMTFNITDDCVMVKYNDLQYKYEMSSMPEGIVCNNIYQIFNDTMADNTSVIENDDRYYIEGNTKDCKYKMFLGESGLPIQISESESGMNVDIKNVTLIK